MTLEAGTIQRLRVAREVSPYGYFMTDEEQDVILHYTELTRPIEIDEEIDVFLFFDTEDRLASTMKKPLITLNEVAALKVADVHPRYGMFLEMGIGRQLLLPMSEMPEFKPLRPQLGDSIYVKLIHDKVGRLVAKMAGEEDLEKLVFHAPQSWLNTWHEAVVYRALRKGTFFVVEGGPLGFGAIGLLHESERPTALRVGARVRVRISHVREDGRVNVTLAERKEVGMDQDAVKLFGFLKERPNGAMPYSDETPADIVKQRFEMSKSAFKRAMGRLMKAGYCTQEGSWTKLTELGATVDPAVAAQTLGSLPSEWRKPAAASSSAAPKAGHAPARPSQGQGASKRGSGKPRPHEGGHNRSGNQDVKTYSQPWSGGTQAKPRQASDRPSGFKGDQERRGERPDSRPGSDKRRPQR